jgi:surface antigen
MKLSTTLLAVAFTSATLTLAPPAEANAPFPFVKGRLGCAANVNAALMSMGYRGTGDNHASSFRGYGSSTQPTTGAITLYKCCGPTGHVNIVQSVNQDGTMTVWNPTRSGWVLQHRSIRSAYAFRSPSSGYTNRELPVRRASRHARTVHYARAHAQGARRIPTESRVSIRDAVAMW